MEEEINYLKKYAPKENLEEALRRLHNNEPVQYIVGNVNFCGCFIKVDKRVLIPRFETEELVARTVKYAKNLTKPLKIIDLGTGSGCIAIALKKYLHSTVDALDISEDALELAQENALINKVEINFYHASMEDEIKNKYDIIIANPPYIPYDGYVQDIVKNNEPSIALFASDAGIYFYKKILSYAFKHLDKNSFIALEIGDKQKDLLEEYLQNNFPLKKWHFEKDLAGLERYLFIFNE